MAEYRIWMHGRRNPAAFFGKTKKSAKATAIKEGKLMARRNVAAGFYDEDGIFHPIRASYDYSPKRGGDTRSRAKKSRRRKRR